MKKNFAGVLVAIFLQLCAVVSLGDMQAPQSIEDLVAREFPNENAPKFESLPSTPQIAIASNDSAILKIMDLKISALPINPGLITFQLHHLLTNDLPARSQIELVWFTDNSTASKNKLDLCPYLEYAKLHCPIKAYKRDEVMQQVLQVPDLVAEGRFSFLAKISTPNGALVAHIAGIIDYGPTDETSHNTVRNQDDESTAGLNLSNENDSHGKLHSEL